MQQKDFLDVKFQALLYTGNSLCTPVQQRVWDPGSVNLLPQSLAGLTSRPELCGIVCQPGQSFYCPGNNLWFPLLCLLHMLQWASTQGLPGRPEEIQRGWSRSNVCGEIHLQTPFISGRMDILWIGLVVEKCFNLPVFGGITQNFLCNT